MNYNLPGICNHLLRERVFSGIKVFGLALGIGTTLLIASYVQHEFSYDRHWDNAPRIFRVLTEIDRNGGNPVTTSENSVLLLPALREYFGDDIEAASQTFTSIDQLQIGDARVDQSITEVDRDFPRIFSLRTVAGNLDAALDGPDGLALSVETARRLFGSTDVIGQTVTLTLGPQQVPLQVEAVYELPSGATILNLQALRQATFDVVTPDWVNNSLTQDYVLLKDGASAERMAQNLAVFTDARVDIGPLEAGPGVRPSQRVHYSLQNVREIYLHSPFDGPEMDRGDGLAVSVFSVAAAFVLLTSCLNFTILSLCRSERRLRETAIRKLAGAMRMQLLLQYLVELLLIVGLAMIVAMVFVELLAPVFGALLGVESGLAYGGIESWWILLALASAVLLLGGLYPALVLSAQSPLQVLRRSMSWSNQRGVRLRSMLTTFQFIVSVVLVIATTVVFLQIRALGNREPGFNPQGLLVIDQLNARAEVRALRQTLRREAARLPGVSAVSLSAHRPGQQDRFANYQVAVSAAGDVTVQLPVLGIDQAYFSTYEVPLLAGRDFDETRDREARYFSAAGSAGETNASSAILNRSAAHELGFTTPQAAIGKRVSLPGFINEAIHYLDIVGVVEDSLVFSQRKLPRAEVYLLDSGVSSVLTLRYQGSLDEVRSNVEQLWRAVMGNQTLYTSVVELALANEFAAERTAGRMLISFASLSLLIACFGLFASTAFSVQARTREIGIKRILGAGVAGLVVQLLWQFSRPVAWASLLAWPIAWFMMEHWLQTFAYRIELTPAIFIGGGAAALCVAWITVGTTATRAASAKPVHALQYEY